MSVTPSSTVVGVFRDRSMAEQAIEALYDAGFTQEQIHYSVPGSSGKFFEDLKSLFTGPGDSLVNDLTSMGVSDEDARYYANEYQNGNTILAVHAAGHEQDALSILHQYGASIHSADPSKETVAQPSDYARSDMPYTTPEQPAHTWQAPQPQTAEAPPFQENQMETVSPEHDLEAQKQQPGGVSAERDIEAQAYQPETASTEHESASQGVQPVAFNSDSDPRTTQTDVVTPAHNGQTARPGDYTTDPLPVASAASAIGQESVSQIPQSDVATPEREVETRQPQAGAAPSEHVDELEQLQQQLQSLQQQLQEAKAQLQSEKERETQLRDRHQKLQEARQQLQDLQSELEATQAELRETRERMKQYQPV